MERYAPVRHASFFLVFLLRLKVTKGWRWMAHFLGVRMDV
jgi:hypothetical protein